MYKVIKKNKLREADYKSVKKWTYSKTGPETTSYITLNLRAKYEHIHRIYEQNERLMFGLCVYKSHKLSTPSGIRNGKFCEIHLDKDHLSPDIVGGVYSTSRNELPQGSVSYCYSSVPIYPESTRAVILRRPLNIIGCLQDRHTLVLPDIGEEAKSEEEIINIASAVYATTISHGYRKSTVSDFRKLSKREWSLHPPTESEFKSLSMVYDFYTVLDHEEQPALVFSTRPVPLKKTVPNSVHYIKSKEVILGYVEKSSSLETDDDALPYLRTMLGIINSSGYHMLNCVNTGLLANTYNKLYMIPRSVTYIAGILSEAPMVSLLR